MRSKLLSLFLIIIVAFTAGCGGGSHKSSSSTVTTVTSEPGYTWGKDSAIFEDVSLTNGSGQVTLALNGSVGTLIAIPYNTATSEGTYSSTITITGDLKTLSVIPVTSKVSFKSSVNFNSKFEAKLREREREILSDFRSKINSSGIKKTSSIRRSTNYESGDTTVKFKPYHSDEASITATKKYDGTNCLIYLDNSLLETRPTYLSDANITQLGKTFDSFYDNEKKYFGDPSSLLDAYLQTYYSFTKNDKIYILISELDSDSSSWTVGYFYVANEFPASAYSDSNEKKMLCLTSYKPDSKTDTEWTSIIKGTMAHEFQHLIFSNNRFTKYTAAEYDSDTWINEGLSMVAEDLAIKGPGYIHNSDLDYRVNPYLENSVNNSLCTWGDKVDDYAPAYMFMRYFVDRYGEKNIINLIRNNSIGKAMLTSVASDSTFTGLFRDWLAAVALDRINYSSADSKYLYRTLDLSSYTGITFGTQSTGTVAIPDTTGGYIIKTGLSSVQKLTVAIMGDSNFGLRLILLPTSFTVKY